MWIDSPIFFDPLNFIKHSQTLEDILFRINISTEPFVLFLKVLILTFLTLLLLSTRTVFLGIIDVRFLNFIIFLFSADNILEFSGFLYLICAMLFLFSS